MNELNISADPSINTEGLDFVLKGSRFDILENKVTLCVPDGVENGVTSFDDMAQKLKDEIPLAMGNEDVPVGQCTQKILAYYELDEAALAAAGHITYGSNVKEVTTKIPRRAPLTAASSTVPTLTLPVAVVDLLTADMCGQVIYPAAVRNTSKHQKAAQAFLEYLKTPEASAIFEGRRPRKSQRLPVFSGIPETPERLPDA